MIGAKRPCYNPSCASAWWSPISASRPGLSCRQFCWAALQPASSVLPVLCSPLARSSYVRADSRCSTLSSYCIVRPTAGSRPLSEEPRDALEEEAAENDESKDSCTQVIVSTRKGCGLGAPLTSRPGGLRTHPEGRNRRLGLDLFCLLLQLVVALAHLLLVLASEFGVSPTLLGCLRLSSALAGCLWTPIEAANVPSCLLQVCRYGENVEKPINKQVRNSSRSIRESMFITAGQQDRSRASRCRSVAFGGHVRESWPPVQAAPTCNLT